MFNEIPVELSATAQASHLAPLGRLLELDGYSCDSTFTVKATVAPLLVQKNGKRLAVGVQSGLLDADWKGHSLHDAVAKSSLNAKVLNDYILRRNLPDEHQLIRDVFEATS
jgi:hypothetical protein